MSTSLSIPVEFRGKLKPIKVPSDLSWTEFSAKVGTRFEDIAQSDKLGFTYTMSQNTFTIEGGGDWEDYCERAVAGDFGTGPLPRLVFVEPSAPADELHHKASFNSSLPAANSTAPPPQTLPSAPARPQSGPAPPTAAFGAPPAPLSSSAVALSLNPSFNYVPSGPATVVDPVAQIPAIAALAGSSRIKQKRTSDGLPMPLDENSVGRALRTSRMWSRFTNSKTGEFDRAAFEQFHADIQAELQMDEIDPVSASTVKRRTAIHRDWQTYVLAVTNGQVDINHIWHRQVVVAHARGFLILKVESTTGEFDQYVLAGTLEQWMHTLLILIIANCFEYVDGKPVYNGYQLLGEGGLFDHMDTCIKAIISRKKLLRHSLREKTHLGYPEQRMLVNDRLIRSENDADDRLVALQVIGTETLLYAYGARPGSIVASSERGLEQGQYMKLGDFSIRRGFDPATYTVTGIIKNFKGYNYGAHAKHETVVLTPAQNFINIVCDPVMIVAYFFARGALNIKDLNELIFGVGEITIRESAKDEPLYCKLRPIGGDRVTLMPTTPAGAGAISEQLREACRRVLNKTATVYAYRREVANHLQMVLGSELAAVVMSHVDVGQRDVLHRSYSSRTANLDLMAYANREGEVSASALTRDRMMESIRPAVLHLAANPDALQVPISRHQRTWEDDHIDSTEDPANSIEARNLVRSVDNVKVGQRKTIIAKDEEDETKNDPRYISALRLAEEAFVKFLEAHGDYTPAPDAKGRKTPAEFLKVSGNISKIEKSFDSSAFSVEKKEKIAKLKQEAKNAFDNLRRLHDNLRDQIRRDRQLAKLSEQTSTTIYEQERAKQVLAGPMPVLKGVMQPPGKRAPRPSDGTDLSHILPNSAISNTAHILPSSTTSRIAPPSSTPVTASSDPTILSSIQRATQSAQDHGTNDGLTSIGDEINDSDAAGLDGDVESPSDDIDVDELQSELRSTDAGRRGEAIRKAKGGFESFMVRHLTQKGAKNQIPDTVTPLSTISEEPTRAKARPQEGLVPGLRGDKENTMMPELPAAPLKIAVGDKTFKVSIAAWTGRVHLLRYLLDPVNKDRSSGAPQVDVDPRPQKQGGGYYCKRDDCALEVTNGRTGTRHEDIVKLVGHLNTIHSAFALKEKEWRKSGPMNCPVCKLGPFADAKEMRKHALRNCDAQLWWFYLRPPRLRDATKDHMGGWSWGKIATMSEPGRKLVLDITALNIPSRHHKHFEAMAEGLPARVPVPSPYDDHEWVELVPVESAPPDF